MAEINYIEINAENRSITIPQSEKLLGVENDSNPKVLPMSENCRRWN